MTSRKSTNGKCPNILYNFVRYSEQGESWICCWLLAMKTPKHIAKLKSEDNLQL